MTKQKEYSRQSQVRCLEGAGVKVKVCMCVCVCVCVCVSMCVCMCVHVCVLSHVQLFASPWTVACQAPLSIEFSRQEYWSGLPCPSLGVLPDPGMKPRSLSSPALAGRVFCFCF